MPYKNSRIEPKVGDIIRVNSSQFIGLEFIVVSRYTSILYEMISCISLSNGWRLGRSDLICEDCIFIRHSEQLQMFTT